MDGRDDEGDGFIDCQDIDCELDPVCAGEGISCQVLSFCYFCCPRGDENCFAACDNIIATLGARAQMMVLRACATQNCGPSCVPIWDCFECVRRQCPAEVENCGLPTYGTEGCFTAYSCSVGCSIPVHTGSTNTCPTDDGIWCVENCFRKARPESGPIARILFYCALENCYNDCYLSPDTDACLTCASNFCAWEFGRCLEDD